MKIVIDVPKDRYETLKMLSETRTFYLDFYQRLIVNGTPLPEGAEILTAEAYSDLCLRASRTPCYLDSPCEYQNEDIKMPPQTEWIPVAERLPDKSGLYLLSIGDLVATFSFDGHTFYRGNIVVSPDAWMPLPKPYEGSEKE